MADALVQNEQRILTENEKDVAEGISAGLSAALIDRLRLTPERIMGMAEGLRVIADLRDPIGEITDGWVRPNGLQISRQRVPLGVVGIIYEARPNVTVDAIGLCIKTGNAVVLRGSSSAYRSNRVITEVVVAAAAEAGIPANAIQLLEDTSRDGVLVFVRMKRYLNLVIPRGGASLIQNVVENATVPSIETGVGNCHIFVDQSADLDQALSIILNAKVQRPSVCNACETVLVHETVSKSFLPRLGEALRESSVLVRGCRVTQDHIPFAEAATEDDWASEYLDLTLAVKVVSSVEDAVAHIRQFGTLHSEAILSNDFESIRYFTSRVDAAAVLVNASTRFVDGGEFGFGAEMGISTQKLHARGPMGLTELTTTKYVILGNGQIRS